MADRTKQQGYRERPPKFLESEKVGKRGNRLVVSVPPEYAESHGLTI